MTSGSTGSTKCVMVINENLPLGLMVNTAGILLLTLGSKVPELVGPDVTDGSNTVHTGITTVPVPILKASEEVVRTIRTQAGAIEGLLVVDFTDAAQTTTTYADYIQKIGATPAEELKYLGILLYGEKKPINKLTGSLPLLR